MFSCSSFIDNSNFSISGNIGYTLLLLAFLVLSFLTTVEFTTTVCFIEIASYLLSQCKYVDDNWNNKMIYIMLNKPEGFVTTVSDDKGRATVMSLVSEIPARIYRRKNRLVRSFGP